MMEVIMHLFQCVICGSPMATNGRNGDGRCFYCADVFRGQTDEQAKASVAETKRLCGLKEAASHLRSALVQALPSDDRIIIEHIREALKILESAPPRP